VAAECTSSCEALLAERRWRTAARCRAHLRRQLPCCAPQGSGCSLQALWTVARVSAELMSFRAVVRCHPGCHGLCLTALRYTLFATRPCARAFLALPPCLLLAGPIGVGLCKGSLLVASLNCHKLEGTFGNLSREGLLVWSTSPVYA